MGKNVTLPWLSFLSPYKKYVQWENLRCVQLQPLYLEAFCLEFFFLIFSAQASDYC